MRTVLVRVLAVVLAVASTGSVGGCGSGRTSDDERPRIVVTTSILGDVVTNLVGEAARVEVVMPPGTDPHDFAPSARQAADMRTADLLVENGLGFEAGLVDTIKAARSDGVRVVTATDHVRVRGEDPHFFTDPAAMLAAANGIAEELASAIHELDTPSFDRRVASYLLTLETLEPELGAILAPVLLEHRILVTNHEVFGYFAARYGFTVLGSVLPRGTTLAEPSAAALQALAGRIKEAGVPAIFAETSAPARLAKALAAEGVGVQVVELYSEALGPPGSEGATYIMMMRTNAQRIADALRGSGRP